MNARPEITTPLFLSRALEPVREWLDQDDVIEIAINRPGHIFVERLGAEKMEHHTDDTLTAEAIRFIGERVAGHSKQAVNAENPLLSAALPTGERIQVILPPAAANGGSVTIRKQVVHDLDLDEYAKRGALSQVRVSAPGQLSELDIELSRLLDKGDFLGFLKTAISQRLSMIISGGTQTGKTTFLNACLKSVPDHERIISIEDTRELKPSQLNYVPLVASKGDQGMARVTIQNLLEASLRIRPDRVFLGELRGEEAFTFLRAINTGHPGSMTTVHADSPAGAYEQVALMVQQAKLNWQKQELMEYIRMVLPIVVQLRKEGGVRGVSEIYFSRYVETK